MELLQIVAGGGAAVALLAGFILFMRGLKDQRSSFQAMMEAQQEILAGHTQESKELSRELIVVIESNTRMLGRVDARLPSAVQH